MFVIIRDVSAAKKAIATLLATAIVLWASGAFSTVQAANITYVKDTLSDSSPSASSTHTIEYVTPSIMAAGETITITFPAGFDLSFITEDDVDLAVNAVDEDTAAVAAGAVWGVSVSGQDLLIESGTDTVPANATVTIEVGSHASAFGSGANDIGNPSSPAGGNESYEIDISAGTVDSGHTRVVILDTVLVTAQVDTTFDFVVYGNSASTAVNGTTTTLTSSSTTIPFGTLLAGQIETLSHDLTVGTNAINGFVVTVQSDGAFQSGTGADIDVFDDGVISTTPASWSTPFNDINDSDTWGHWGVTSEDTNTTRTTEFGSNEWVGIDTTPVILFSHTGPADSVTPNIGSTTVGYQVEITALQEAGDDYSTILTYIATPTF